MRVAEWFECDDNGYPEEASIDRLKAWGERPIGMEIWAAGRFLVHDFPAICDRIACCRVEISDDPEEPEVHHHIEFVTGGWSGAEELIDEMLHHFWIRQCHTRWERGGLYRFEVPKRWLTDEFKAECDAHDAALARRATVPSTDMTRGASLARASTADACNARATVASLLAGSMEREARASVRQGAARDVALQCVEPRCSEMPSDGMCGNVACGVETK